MFNLKLTLLSELATEVFGVPLGGGGLEGDKRPFAFIFSVAG